MLLNWQREDVTNRQQQVIGKHYIVGINAILGRTKNAICIEMLIYAKQTRRSTVESTSQLARSETSERFIESLVLLDTTTWHEPEALSRTIQAMAEKQLAMLVLNNKINGNQRSRSHYAPKSILV
ncbi:MAG: hypothetical protein JL55_14085 [Pseudomonas sp. BICA1-14]|nr:MAG: hypothetical protein JL55_14085 [[Pseudomonas] sp. BICA1-14]